MSIIFSEGIRLLLIGEKNKAVIATKKRLININRHVYFEQNSFSVYDNAELIQH